jgi:hypothetical protein
VPRRLVQQLHRDSQAAAHLVARAERETLAFLSLGRSRRPRWGEEESGGGGGEQGEGFFGPVWNRLRHYIISRAGPAQTKTIFAEPSPNLSRFQARTGFSHDHPTQLCRLKQNLHCGCEIYLLLAQMPARRSGRKKNTTMQRAQCKLMVKLHAHSSLYR